MKDQLITRLNELRTKNDMPTYDPEKLTMTTEEIEKLIYDLENPPNDNRAPPPIPPTVLHLLKRLNVLRVKNNKQSLSEWKKGRPALDREIEKEEQLSKKLATVTKAPTQVAKGAVTKRKNTALNKAPQKMEKAIKKMDKNEKRRFAIEQRDIAKRVALTHGLSKADVLLYLQAKRINRPDGDIKAKVLEFHENRSKALKKPPATGKKKPVQASRRSSGSVTPGDIAAALHLAPRSVRITLRRIEDKLPKGWRVEGERWGFKPEHKQDIVKRVKEG